MNSRGMAPSENRENGVSNGASNSAWNREHDSTESSTIDSLLQTRVDASLYRPDINTIRQDSFKRSRQAMAAIDPGLTRQILHESNALDKQEKAAILIQSQVRGYLARKQYVDLLFEQYEKEEEERLAKSRQQVEEGELLVENYKLSTEMIENSCTRRNLQRRLECSVITIQRAWRRHRLQIAQRGAADYYKPPTIAIDSDDPSFSIHTNPFEKMQSRHVYSDEEEHDQSDDIFNDSLEDIACDAVDDESDDDGVLGVNSVSSPSELPSPTTDWESIESCLTSEGENPDKETTEDSDKRFTDFSLKAQDLQICFVDDTLLTDEEEHDEDGYNIKEYVIDPSHDVSDEEKRDSGCVAGDDDDKESFCIKTVHPDDLISRKISNEESQHILLELTRHEVNLERQQTMQGWTIEKLNELTLEEIKSLRKNFEQLIQAQNEMLVRELMMRDALHLKQDSMLLEVEDSTKNDEMDDQDLQETEITLKNITPNK
ncbi:uncharacterized protein LOC5515469 isoform X1 [Nematostella vectensis]|uniref:uncharacterized protein LOC5515469 isoform X1 n=1 Tax=Nematostella vectensis TaxID=45351 RepID=UPI002076F1B6|nr:uncharacterized protein LOC5515469 isoform X1 [Nematostella vectensis]